MLLMLLVLRWPLLLLHWVLHPLLHGVLLLLHWSPARLLLLLLLGTTWAARRWARPAAWRTWRSRPTTRRARWGTTHVTWTSTTQQESDASRVTRHQQLQNICPVTPDLE